MLRKCKIIVKLLVLVIIVSMVTALLYNSDVIATLASHERTGGGVWSILPSQEVSAQTDNTGNQINQNASNLDIFLKTFQSRYSSHNVFALNPDEPYHVFLKRLNSLKKKGKTLIGGDEQISNNSMARFHRGISQYYMYDPNDDSFIQELIDNMAALPIVSVAPVSSGKTFKLMLTFSDGSQARFKPMRIGKDMDTESDQFLWSFYERHNAEIAAFHLDRLLGFNYAIPTVGRFLNMTSELGSFISNRTLVNYTFISPAGNMCFVTYCRSRCGVRFPICGKRDVLEGSVTARLPITHKFKLFKNPYHILSKSIWEAEDNYCKSGIKFHLSIISNRSLYDTIEMAVLDTLMGNVDRHHYEMFKDLGRDSFRIFMDNGRAFANAKFDNLKLLIALTQCCKIRLSTLAKLVKLYQGPDSLSSVMRESMNSDPVSPVLPEFHLQALDRRLGIVIKTVSDCFHNGLAWEDVVMDDSSDSG